MPKKGDNLDSVTATTVFDHLPNRVMRYTPPGLVHESASTVSVNVVFDSGSVEGFDGVGNVISHESTRVSCLIADLPKVKKSGLLTIYPLGTVVFPSSDGVDFKVDRYDRTSPYTVRLELHDR